jgi:aryl-alcohol dehydrogenase-like predicted oxidoreductase
VLQRRIANRDVGAIGLGCMGMTYAYTTGMPPEADRIEVVRRAVDLGANLIDTADVYGPYTSEELIGQALRGRHEAAVIATKVGLVLGQTADGQPALARDGRPEHLKAAVEDSLRRLGTDHIDLCQLHRVDDAVPLPESWGALAGLVQAGLVRAIGLSDVRPEQAAAAHAVWPVATVQNELSVWNADDEMVAWTRGHGAGFIAYAPLGRGMLARRFASPRDLAEDDMRRWLSRLGDGNLGPNLSIVERIAVIAARHQASPAQVALAWVLAQGPHVVAIPGTKRLGYLTENVRAASLALTAADLAELDALPAAAGARL